MISSLFLELYIRDKRPTERCILNWILCLKKWWWHWEVRTLNIDSWRRWWWLYKSDRRNSRLCWEVILRLDKQRLRMKFFCMYSINTFGISGVNINVNIYAMFMIIQHSTTKSFSIVHKVLILKMKSRQSECVFLSMLVNLKVIKLLQFVLKYYYLYFIQLCSKISNKQSHIKLLACFTFTRYTDQFNN